MSARGAALLRVSSGRQADEGLSLDVQRQQVEEYAARHDVELVAVEVERGVSGRREERPGLERLLARSAEWDVLLVPKLDRLARSIRRTHEVVDLLDRQGKRLVSLAEGFDTSTTHGRALLGFLSVMAEMESRMIGDRVRATLPAAKRRRGRKFGGKRPYGREPDGAIREAEARVVREFVVPRFLAGTNEQAIARRLNDDGIPSATGGDWHAAVIAGLLRRPDLCGLVLIEGELVEGSDAPIMPREVWDRIQAVFDARGRAGERRGRDTVVPVLLDDPLVLTCACCGGPMRPRSGRLRKDGSRAASYHCLDRLRHGVERGCPMRSVDRDILDEAVLGVFRRDLVDERATLREIERASKRAATDSRRALAAAERELIALQRQGKVLDRKFRDEEITTDEWRGQRAEVDAELQGAEAEAERLRRHVGEQEAGEHVAVAEQVLLAALQEIRDVASGALRDEDALAACRAALARVVEEVVVVDADLPVAFLGAWQVAAEEEDAQTGDVVTAVSRLHGVGAQGRRVGFELVPRRNLRAVRTVEVGGQRIPAYEPVRTEANIPTFSEVKEKRGSRFGDPLEMVTAEKQRRLRRAAEAWLGARPELGRLAVGFDVIAVRDGRVSRLPQAF